MTKLIEKAKKNNRNSLKELYNINKKKVMLICELLLNDEKNSSLAVVSAFRDAFKELKNNKINTEEDFRDYVYGKAVTYSKNQIVKKNPKAYILPSRKEFKGTDSELQRLVYVANKVAWLEGDKLLKATELNEYTLKIVMDTNLYALSGKMDVDNKESHIKVPESVDSKIIQIIDKMSEETYKESKGKKITYGIIAFVVIAIVAVLVFAIIKDGKSDSEKANENISDTQSTDNQGGSDEQNKDNADKTEYVTEINADWFADIEIEDYGTIKVGLDSKFAPETVANFVELAESGFYDGLTFHRIMEDFMMQGGDPTKVGRENTAENIKGEFTSNGSSNNLSHVRGAISMARAEDYNSASSQFFIVHKDSLFLDGEYAAFGYVTEGMDIVDKICTSAEPTDSNGTIPKEEQPVIKSIKVYQ